MSDRDTVLSTVEDLVRDFLVHDRKEDEDLPRGEIEKLIKDDELTIDDIVERFREALEERLGNLDEDEDEEEDEGLDFDDDGDDEDD